MNQKQIGLYIHIPFCKQKCYYCDFPSYSGMEEYWEAYIDALVSELIIKAEEYKNPDIMTIFIGGGTPSLIPATYISKVLNTVYKNYNVLPDCESTIECNPGTLNDEKLRAYKNFGLNRLSIGLQACQDEILKQLGRIHTFEDFLFSLKLAQKHEFQNLNADIIFGIPNQTFADWQDTIDRILALDLAHISCYSLLIEDGTVFGELKEKGLIKEAEDELDRKMYHYAVERFNESGLYQYEISNFAKPHLRCRHNMNYWRRGEYLGVGAGAHSHYNKRRFANTADVSMYIEGVKKGKFILTEDNHLSKEDELEESIFLGLRLTEGIDFSVLSKEYGIDLEKKNYKKLEKLISQKLVERDGTMLRLTKKGMDLANAVIVELI
ncbi:MAG: radical SAM family heme chaperone HemW [Acetivibrionales bacterium]|jgi:oxygen-independent coproporphyrinogen-3 oxidase|nr:oxygen-independent coproporphyrinogen III oxidase [Clostridiaceae bacterium]